LLDNIIIYFVFKYIYKSDNMGIIDKLRVLFSAVWAWVMALFSRSSTPTQATPCPVASSDCKTAGIIQDDGTCSIETDKNDGILCDDGNAATTGTVCTSGVCAGVAPAAFLASVDCVGSWDTTWSACSEVNGVCTQTLGYIVTTPAANGGLECSDPTTGHWVGNSSTRSRPCSRRACSGSCIAPNAQPGYIIEDPNLMPSSLRVGVQGGVPVDGVTCASGTVADIGIFASCCDAAAIADGTGPCGVQPLPDWRGQGHVGTTIAHTDGDPYTLWGCTALNCAYHPDGTTCDDNNDATSGTVCTGGVCDVPATTGDGTTDDGTTGGVSPCNVPDIVPGYVITADATPTLSVLSGQQPVSGITCNPTGYTGTIITGSCHTGGVNYTLSGCDIVATAGASTNVVDCVETGNTADHCLDTCEDAVAQVITDSSGGGRPCLGDYSCQPGDGACPECSGSGFLAVVAGGCPAASCKLRSCLYAPPAPGSTTARRVCGDEFDADDGLPCNDSVNGISGVCSSGVCADIQWVMGSGPDENCNDTCARAGRSCIEEDWNIHTSMTASWALAATSNLPDGFPETCQAYDPTYPYNLDIYPLISNDNHCEYAVAAQPAACDVTPLSRAKHHTNRLRKCVA